VESGGRGRDALVAQGSRCHVECAIHGGRLVSRRHVGRSGGLGERLGHQCELLERDLLGIRVDGRHDPAVPVHDDGEVRSNPGRRLGRLPGRLGVGWLRCRLGVDRLGGHTGIDRLRGHRRIGRFGDRREIGRVLGPFGARQSEGLSGFRSLGQIGRHR